MDIPQGLTLGQRIQNFAYDNIPFVSRPQTAEQILAQGYQQGSTLPGLSGFLNSISRFNELPRGDQAFIARNTGYRGPTVFGENTGGGNVDPFGLNVTSGFGNYAEAVEKQVDRLDDYFGGEKFDKKYGKDTKLQLDEETGLYSFVGKNAAEANRMNKMNLARYNFYTNQVNQRNADRRAAEERIQRQAERTRQIQQQLDTGTYGRDDPPDRDRRNVTTASAARTSGVGGGGYTQRDSVRDSRRGRYMMGGLTDLVDIYD